MAKLKPSVVDRIGAADPVMSMGTRLWEWASAWFGPFTVSSIWSAAVTYSAYLSSWWGWLEPLGVTLLAFCAFVVALPVTAAFSFWRARAALVRTKIKAYEDLQIKSDAVNPLQSEFHRQRLRIEDLVQPFDRTIEDKLFTQCELLGPANIGLVEGCKIDGFTLVGCDVVPLRGDALVYNVIGLTNVRMVNCSIFKCTIFVHSIILP